MHVNANRITQVLATPEERRTNKRVTVTSREALQYLLADWGFVAGITLKSRSAQQTADAPLTGLRKRLLAAPVAANDESGKIISLIKAANHEGIAHLTITITKTAALQLRGRIDSTVLPKGAKLCFATESNGNITVGVAFQDPMGMQA